ncbi:unnamed protein product [Acanthoscelides obtectus]|uniref:Uncharacterized protein n=1 Tax=Acanthoscelides obtectus TaxID=200917 RepID=A0A9P0PIZ3_ACAOB|nr:unnamed protein product [Acanthoscelides obtectus]CAK1653142.1 hypothetical protein AOBTE_LOCUS18087 [Acanthoscelides obtectus]
MKDLQFIVCGVHLHRDKHFQHMALR